MRPPWAGRRRQSGTRARLAGHEPPTNSKAVKTVLRGIRRTIGAAPVQKAPVCADHLRIVLQTCLDTLRGMRDRALLAPGFAGALRRSELVALQVGDFVEVPDGLRLVIRISKTDQEGVGQEIASPPRLPPPPRASLPRVAGGGRHATV